MYAANGSIYDGTSAVVFDGATALATGMIAAVEDILLRSRLCCPQAFVLLYSRALQPGSSACSARSFPLAC
jgi:hypothetical protein